MSRSTQTPSQVPVLSQSQIPQQPLGPPTDASQDQYQGRPRSATEIRSGLVTISRSYQMADYFTGSVRPSLQTDIQKYQGTTFPRFLRHALFLVRAIPSKALGTESEQDIQDSLKPFLDIIIKAMKDPNNSQDMQTITHELEQYCALDTEPKRYKPFVHAINTVLHLLQKVKIKNVRAAEDTSDDYLVYFCHDSKHTYSEHNGTSYGRKPDITSTSRKNFLPLYDKLHQLANKPRATRSTTLDLLKQINMSVVTNPDCALDWKHHYNCVEMKRHNAKLKTSPHQEYNARYSAVPPEQFDYTQKVVLREPQVKASATDVDELKSIKHLDGADQCAEDAAEIWYNSFARDHVINLAVNDEILRVWYFDHEGPILTTGIDFIKDMPYFFLLLLAFQRFRPKDWGHIPGLDLANSEPHDIELSSEHSHENQPAIFTRFPNNLPREHRQFTLGGRATNVIYGNYSGQDGPMALKLSWREKSRDSEGEFIRIAKQRLLDLEVLYAGRRLKLSDCLPTLHWEKEFPEFSTREVRKSLGIELRERSERVPYALLLPKYTSFIERTKNGLEWVDDFSTLLYCGYRLWEAGIEHRDISVSNLMWDAVTQTPKLCDFDLSHFSETEGPAGFTNTGTFQFMALDLLSEEPGRQAQAKRVFRHELESYFAVFVWMILNCNNGAVTINPQVLKWNAPSPEACGRARTNTYRSLNRQNEPSHILRKIWIAGRDAAQISLDLSNRNMRLIDQRDKHAGGDMLDDHKSNRYKFSKGDELELERLNSTAVIEMFLDFFVLVDSKCTRDILQEIKKDLPPRVLGQKITI